jgi:uncharacterized membrane protein HdeD (DUF308 family)
MRLITSKQITSSNWWLLALQAIVAIIVGIAIIAWPQLSLAVFIYLFGVFVVVDGIVAMGLAITRRKESAGWWAILLGGMLGVIVGILIFVNPRVTGLFMAYLVAIWALVIGIFSLVQAFSPETSSVQRWTAALTGILALLLGVFLFVRPGSGILSLTWLVGAFCIVYGVLLLIRVMFPGKAASISSEVPERVEQQQ